ncbi:transcriptional regulator [Deinococcus taklimakanensis]|uniref:Transcriptional regulator n=1 Tax=Deinococcus taklimakanensis TaxID=536443 RepID=A0ABW5P3Z5_9DEIO
MRGRGRPAVLAALLTALFVCPAAQAADADDLSAALRRARTLEARGTVSVTVNFPPRAQAQRQAARLPAVPFRPALLLRNFRVSRGPDEAVAGRPAARYDLSPLNTQAARWTLWIDRVWNVPLAYEERGADGALARRAALTEVRGAARTAARAENAPTGLRGAVLEALPGLKFPPGFAPVAARAVAGQQEVTLSDGVNVLSLVVSPRGVQAAPGVASRRVGGRFVWLVGNLPPEALAAALSGIRAVRPEALGTFLAPAASKP